MTIEDVFEQAQHLTDDERQELIFLLIDSLKGSKNQHKLLELEPIDLGGLREGVRLVTRAEIYGDTDSEN